MATTAFRSVIPYDVLLGVVILADDGQFVHIKPGPLELLHCLLGLGVGLINGNNRVPICNTLRRAPRCGNPCRRWTVCSYQTRTSGAPSLPPRLGGGSHKWQQPRSDL